MNRYEKFIILFILSLFLGRAGAFGIDIYCTTLTELKPISVTHPFLYMLRLAVPYLSHLVIAIWLFSETSSTFGRKSVWFVFGLCTGLIGVIVFYVIKSWQTLDSSSTDRIA